MNQKTSVPQVTPQVTIDGSDLTLEQILSVARADSGISISSHPDFSNQMEASRHLLYDAMEKGLPVYGVTTGFGKCCGKRMVAELAVKNGINLIRFHGCGTGEPFDTEAVRAAMICRLICFSKGYSGVSISLLEQISSFLNHGITPVIPSEGSVGASGDLTPMSYLAATLMGERDVIYQGGRLKASEAMKKAGIHPYSFGPKEPLAIMNGTAMMTGIAALIIDQAGKILNAAVYATALTIHAIGGNTHHYHPTISKAKPHPGQGEIARLLSGILKSDDPENSFSTDAPEALQDPYSVRCSPQILGVLADAISWVKQWVEIEANSANDNPIFDTESGQVLMGGNFYGGHIAFAMDSLKAALASVADMCDRQVALMVDANVNRGLPSDLVRVEEQERPFHHGFKAMSISASALAAEALKATMPAASFSRSTESHNQDKVSMGTIAARDTSRGCNLVEKTLAVHILTSAQACEIKGRIDKRPQIETLLHNIREIAGPTIEDRPMDMDIHTLTEAISHGALFEFENKPDWSV